VRKIALIVNGDTEARHLENVERSLRALAADGYETYVVSPRQPKAPCDRSVSPTLQNVRDLTAQLKGDADVDLAIYTTGHGDYADGDGKLCLLHTCNYREIASALDAIRYGRRVVIMDQCYGGNFAQRFLDDPKTLFISAGSDRQQTCCQDFSVRFWSPDRRALDRNGDGVVSWQERFDYAMAVPPKDSTPTFIASEGYVQPGKAPFEPRLLRIHDQDAFTAALRRLRPGQWAIVNFSIVDCGACTTYAPFFEKFAREDGGQHLWLLTARESIAQKYGITSFPTVMAVNAKGEAVPIRDLNALLKSLGELHFVSERRLRQKIDEAEKLPDEHARATALVDIASLLLKASIKDKQAIFQRLIAVAKKMIFRWNRVVALAGIAKFLQRAGFGTASRELLAGLAGEAEKVADASDRSREGTVIARSLAESGFQREAWQAFQKALAAAALVERRNLRAFNLRRTAIALVESGYVAEAERVYGDVVSAISLMENAVERVTALSLTAESLFECGLAARGMKVLRQTIAAIEPLRVSKDRRSAIRDAACVFAKISASSPGVTEAISALTAIIKKETGAWERLQAYASLSESLGVSGLRNEAEDAFQQTIAAAEQLGDAASQGLALRKVSDAFAKSRLTGESKAVFQNFVAAVGRISDAAEQANTFIALAKSCAALGLMEWTRRSFLKAIDASNAIRDPFSRMEALTLAARWLAAAMPKEDARPIFQLMIAAAKRIDHLPARTEALRSLARHLSQAGYRKDAQQILWDL
jgi:tetratricopeptide (TPR) repeat protein